MAIDFKTILESLLPKGAAWVAKSGGGLDNLLEGLGETFSGLRDGLEALSNIRDPETTTILSDLEHEYGLIPDVGLTDAERRETLKGLVFAKPGMGVDHMTAELHKAGFTDLFAYQNDPAINPEFYTDGTWSAWCGGEDSFCGGEDAYCGYESGGGGYILINDNSADATTSVPNDPTIWHLVFFIGGVRTDETVGWFLLVDGDQEAATTAAWTAGAHTDLAKDAVLFYEGLQSLKVNLTPRASTSDREGFYADQDLGVDSLDADLLVAPIMHDEGGAVLYDTAFDWSDKSRNNGENGDAGDVLGFGVKAGGTNAADKLAIDFLDAQLARVAQAMGDEGSLSAWVKINDASRAPTYDFVPSEATGYGDLPEDLTINGTTVSPAFRYEAQNADLTSWVATVGDDLPIVSVGVNPTFDELAPGPEDERVKFNASDYYQAASAGFAAIGSDDFIYEFIGAFSDGDYAWGRTPGSGTDRTGFIFTAGVLYFVCGGVTVQTSAISAGEYVHLIVFVDRSGSAVMYYNGVATAAVVVSSVTTIGDAYKLALGATSSGSSPSEGSLSFLSMWHSPAWLNTHLQPELAQARASIAMGIYPQIAQDVDSTTLSIPVTTSGYAALDQDLTINSVTKSPTFRYEAGSATTSVWTATVGDDLAIAGSGTSPVIDEYAPGLTDKRVKFNAGEWYEAAASSYGQPSTDDLVIECIWKHENEVTLLASKYVGAGDTIEVGALATSALQLNLNGTLISTPALVADTYNHLIVFLDRSGSGICYLNGAAGTAVSISALAAVDLGTTAKWTIGARTGGALQTNSSLAYLSMWQGAAWLDTHLQADVAKERFYKACGVWPELAGVKDYIVDGDMEASGVTSWTQVSCVLSKDTSNPAQGSQALRVTYAGVNNGEARQTILTVGERYRITGYARGDGTYVPSVRIQSAAVWAGTNSDQWQEIDVEGIADGTLLRLYSSLSGAGFVEFDNISVTRSLAYPEVASRSTVAYIDKLDSNGDIVQVPVGANWVRACERKDLAATTLSGYLPETQATNLVLTSEGGTGWALVDAGDTVNLAAAVAPDGETTALELIADSTDGQHGYSHGSLTLTAASYTASAWAKLGDVNFVKLECSTIANAYAYFDILNGTVETEGAAAVGRITGPYIGDYYRCEITFTGTAAAHTFRALSCAADNDDTIVGDGATVNTYLWGLQVEQADWAGSRVETIGASATRVKDIFRTYAGMNIGGEDHGRGRVECNILLPNANNSGVHYPYHISDGGSGSNSITTYVSSNDEPRFIVTDGGVAQSTLGAGAGDMSDGNIKSLATTYSSNSFELFVDGVSKGTDSLGTIPDDLDQIGIGQAGSAAGSTGQLNGLIGNIKVYSTTEGTVPGYLPKVVGRASSALVEKVLSGDTETALIPVGANWMRVDRAFDKDLGPVQGYHPESIITNRLTYSEDFGNAAWTKTNCAITTGATTALGEQSFDAIVGDATAGIHAVTQAAAIPTIGVYVVSAYVKAGDKTFWYCDVSEVTNGYCYFDLGSSTYSAGAGVENAHIENKGDGVFRIVMAVSVPGATATTRFAPADAFGDYTFTGDSATVNGYIFGAQIERSTGDLYVATSYQKTVAAIATRTADILTAHGGANVGGEAFTTAAIRAEFMHTIDTSGAAGNEYLVDIGDGSVLNGIEIMANIAAIVARVDSDGTNQALLNGAWSTYTGEKQVYEIGAKLDDFRLYTERVEETTDTSGNMPTGTLDRLDLGQRSDSTLQFNGIIPRITISPYGLSNPRGIMGTMDPATDLGQFVGYDDKFDGTFEILASGDVDGLVQMRSRDNATIIEGEWVYLGLSWQYLGGGTLTALLSVNGEQVSSYFNTGSDPTIAAAQILYGVAALKNALTGGAVSISKPKVFSAGVVVAES